MVANSRNLGSSKIPLPRGHNVLAAIGWLITWIASTGVQAENMILRVGTFKILWGSKAPLQKTSSTREGKKKAESGLTGLLVGCQSSAGFTNPVAVATIPAIVVVPKVIAATSNHLSRGIGVITDRIARFAGLDKIMANMIGERKVKADVTRFDSFEPTDTQIHCIEWEKADTQLVEEVAFEVFN